MLDYSLDRDQLHQLAEQYREAYTNAEPYPHVVIDNLFPESVLEELLNEFPDPQSNEWLEYHREEVYKRVINSEDQFGPKVRSFMHQLMSLRFLDFLESLTGIKNVISDPLWGGGGMHLFKRGGYDGVHADFNKQPRTKLDRRLNVLLYLNKDWREEYCGHLELWDRSMQRAVKKILPVFNRLVVFSTNDVSYHGLPEPLQCPEGIYRRSLALYFYTNGRPQEDGATSEKFHTTQYQKRPQDCVSAG